MKSISVEPTKDPDKAHPVAQEWRPFLQKIVHTLVESELELPRQIAFAPASEGKLAEIYENIAAYGESLIALADETWDTSVAQWMGTHWDVLVDLWTAESGRSDLVLAVRVFEVGGAYQFEVDSVYVP